MADREKVRRLAAVGEVTVAGRPVEMFECPGEVLFRRVDEAECEAEASGGGRRGLVELLHDLLKLLCCRRQIAVVESPLSRRERDLGLLLRRHRRLGEDGRGEQKGETNSTTG